MKNKIFIPKKIKDEISHFKKTRIPRCIKCKKEFEQTYDEIAKEITGYLWEQACNCSKKKLQLCIG